MCGSDQVFVLKNFSGKYLEKGKDMQAAFLDLEKVYVNVIRDALWKVLHI